MILTEIYEVKNWSISKFIVYQCTPLDEIKNVVEVFYGDDNGYNRSEWMAKNTSTKTYMTKTDRDMVFGSEKDAVSHAVKNWKTMSSKAELNLINPLVTYFEAYRDEYPELMI